MKSRTTQSHTARRTAAVESYGAIAVTGVIGYYCARVLHHYPRIAAQSIVYKSSMLVTTNISLGEMLHECTYNNLFSCIGLASRGIHNNSRSNIPCLTQQQQCKDQR